MCIISQQIRTRGSRDFPRTDGRFEYFNTEYTQRNNYFYQFQQIYLDK
jgi:hypothetical protein